MEITNNIFSLVENEVRNNGYILYDIEIDKLGASDVLRILIQRSDYDSVDLDDCVKVTHALTPILDNESSLDKEYMLEVASPGVIRTLKTDEHLKQVVGQLLEITTYSKLPDFEQKTFKSILKSYCDDELILDAGIVKRNDIKKMSTTFEF